MEVVGGSGNLIYFGFIQDFSPIFISLFTLLRSLITLLPPVEIVSEDLEYHFFSAFSALLKI